MCKEFPGPWKIPTFSARLNSVVFQANIMNNPDLITAIMDAYLDHGDIRKILKSIVSLVL